ncbi:MAG: PaaI family thioesterase [Gammaproteobacteria bacterium]|nr:MAG: PaaI family thioesterase [Gammaproteobacteria bacterium]
MIDTTKIPAELLPILQEKLKNNNDEIHIPPAVFNTMGGKFLEFNQQNKTLKNSFPILSQYLNPYGNLQGGIIATAIDNTIGPLSLLVAPPNFTRYLDLKYGKIVTMAMKNIYVTATFIEQKKRQLFFSATVENKTGDKLATASATHWVI